VSWHNPLPSLWSAGGLICGCLVAFGCTPEGPQPVACRGEVYVDGERVDGATLILMPPESDGRPFSTLVQDGKFAFDEQTGPLPGEYAVGVYAEPAPLEAVVDANRERTHASVRKLRSEFSDRLVIEPDATRWSVEISQDQSQPMELRWPPDA